MGQPWSKTSRTRIARAMALLLLTLPSGVGATASSTGQSREEEGTPKPSALTCAIAWRPGCPGEAEAVQGLVRGGPSGVTYPLPNEFSAQGFIQSGWPIVVKYQVPTGAITTLSVKPQFGGGEQFGVRLPKSNGLPQLYSFPAEVPGSNGKVVVANFSITARDGAGAVVPVSVLGIGAGPRAVGSIAIDQIRTDPPSVRRPTGNDRTDLTFTYLLENDWDLVSEDLWRDCTHISIFCNWSHPNNNNPYHASGSGQHTWKWTVSRRAKLGQYNLVIRAWHTCGTQVDVNSYHQCGKQLDWVIGSAGPVFIQ